MIVHERYGSGLLEKLHLLEPQLAAEQTFVIVVAEQMTVTEAILCTKHGALDYLGWPVLPNQFLEIAERTRKQKEFASAMQEQADKKPEKKPEPEGRVMIGKFHRHG